MTLSELAADPNFKRLPYAEQQKARARVVLEAADQDPSIPDMVKLQVAQEAMALPPVFSEGVWESHSEQLNRVLEIAAQAKVGAPGGREAAQSLRFMLEDTKNNILDQAIFGIADAVMKVFGKDDEVFKGMSQELGIISMPENDKVLKILQDATGDTGALSIATAGAMFGQIRQFTSLNKVLVGTLGSPGLLTQGLFKQAGARMAAKAAGVGADGAVQAVGRGSRLLWGAVAPFIVEKGAEGLIDSGVDLAEAYLQGDIRVPKDAMTYFAKGFGEGVAADLVVSLGGSVLKKVGVALRGTYLKHDWTNVDLDKVLPFTAKGGIEPLSPDILERYMSGTLTEDYLQALPEAEAKRLVARAQDVAVKLRNAAVNSDPRTPDGFSLLALSQGFEADVLPSGKVKVSDYVFQTDAFKAVELPDLPTAQRWMHDYRIGLGQRAVGKMEKEAMASLSKSLRVSRLLSTEVDPVGVQKEVLAQAIQPVGGIVNPDSALAFGKAFMKTTGAAEGDILGLKVRVADDFFDKGVTPVRGELVVPRNILNAAQEQQWMYSLQEQLGKQAGEGGIGAGGAALFKAIGEQAESSPLTHTSLGLLVQGRLGGRLLDVGGSYKIELPDGTAATFGSLAEASRWAGSRLTKSGLIDDEGIGTMFKKNTGLDLSIVERPDLGEGVKQYTPTFQGKQQNPGDVFNIDELLVRYPQAFSALPETLAPKSWFIGDRLVQQGDAIVGDARSLREYMTTFSRRRAGEVLEVTASGDRILKVPLRQSFLVEDATTGLRAEFPTYAKAKNFMKRLADGAVPLERIATQRGYTLSTGATGDYFLVAKGQPAKSFNSKKALMNYLAARPDPEWMPSLPGVEDPFAETVAGQARMRFGAEDLSTLRKGLKPEVAKRLVDPQGDHPVADILQQAAEDDAKLPIRTLLDRAFGQIRSIVEPGYDNLVREAERYGVPLIGETVEEFGVLKKGAASATLKADRLIRRVFQTDSPLGGRTLPRSDLERLSYLIEYPREMWDKVMNTHGFTLKDTDAAVVDNANRLFKALNKVFGIEDAHSIMYYAPRLRDAWKECLADPAIGTRISKKDFFARAFGQSVPKSVRFMSENMRLDAFMGMMTKHNLLDQMMTYAYEGYRKLYLGDFWSTRVAALQKSLKAKVPQALYQRFEEFFKAAIGTTGSSGDVINRSVSLNLTMALSQMMEKAPDTAAWGRFLRRHAEGVITNDLTGRLSHRQTMGMLAFRPFRGLANLAQYNNVYALYGKQAFEAFEEVDDAYIKKTFDTGILSDSMVGSRPKVETRWGRIEHIAMRPQENSEVLSRAATAKTVEKAFDKAFAAYAKGSLDLKGFLRETRADVLLDTPQKMFVGMLREGKPAGAKRFLQEQIIREAMGDYSHEGAPRVFQGWLGRIMGKFGTYSMAHANFVARLGERGDAVSRFASLGRFALASVATYETFRALGVDYHGFLFTDPYEFSGGPTLTALIDASNAIGSRWENVQARENLVSTAFASLVPGALEVKSLVKAVDLLQSGDMLEGAWAALGARPSEDNLFNGNFTLFEGGIWDQWFD